MVFPPDIAAIVRARDWAQLEVACRSVLASDPDSSQYLRVLGMALERLADVAAVEVPTAYEDFHPELPPERRLLAAALRAYSRALKRSGGRDEIALDGRERLRARLGYQYETRCWKCKESLSDAPGDNAGRCRSCHWYRCALCGACGCDYEVSVARHSSV